MTDTVTLYRADDGWRWRYEASGRCLADSGQGYSRRIDAVKGACRVVQFAVPDAQTVIEGLRGSSAWERWGIRFVIGATR